MTHNNLAMHCTKYRRSIAANAVAACTQVRSGKGKKGGALDGIGKGGAMAAGGGSGSHDDYAGGSSRRMEFQSGRG